MEEYKKYAWAIGLFFSLVACSPSTKPKPEDILSAAQMVSILQAIHTTEAALLDAQLPEDTAVNLYQQRLIAICQAHQTDTATFEKSFQYYSNRLDDFDKIYEAVIDSLQQQSQQAP